MYDSARQIAEALQTIPCIGDGDTGYGNAVNVKRTVKGYAQVKRTGPQPLHHSFQLLSRLRSDPPTNLF